MSNLPAMQEMVELVAVLRRGNAEFGSTVADQYIERFRGLMNTDHYLFLMAKDNTETWIGHGTPWEAMFSMVDTGDILTLYPVEPDGCPACQLQKSKKTFLKVYTASTESMDHFPLCEGQNIYSVSGSRAEGYVVFVDIGDALDVDWAQESYLERHQDVDWYVVVDSTHDADWHILSDSDHE